MKKTFHRIAVIVALVGVASPAMAQNKREMQMMADIRMLQEQNQLMQVTLAQLGDALKMINSRFDEQANIAGKAFADQRVRIDELSTGLRQVRERVDDSNVRISNMSQEVEALRLAIPQYPPPSQASMIGDPSATGGTSPTGTFSPTPSAPSAPQPTPPTGGAGMSPQRLYDTAWADFTAGQWDLCIAGMDTYLRTFPRSELADDAQLYIGECNYASGKFTEAAAAYTGVITNFPRGDAVPLAYYKRGLTFEQLKQFDRARESFEQVMKMFPDSDPARVAKQALDRINRNRPPN